ncbi:MAG: Spy/CpxP family protein refolding chaperone [Candidatus Omnitrophica bacterium]|nr:Spy/CpxP family protein refolding chaperone [Candidatus Omnitrophota bacterium]
MKNRLWILGVMVVSMFCVAPSAMAADKEKGDKEKPKMEEHFKDMDKNLGLSPDQATKMKALREDFRAKVKPLREQLTAKREALRQEMDGASPDRAKVDALLKETNDLQGQVSTLRIDQMFKTRAILTPEQSQKLREFHEKHKKEMKGRFGKGGAKHGAEGGPGNEAEEHGEGL